MQQNLVKLLTLIKRLITPLCNYSYTVSADLLSKLVDSRKLNVIKVFQFWTVIKSKLESSIWLHKGPLSFSNIKILDFL